MIIFIFFDILIYKVLTYTIDNNKFFYHMNFNKFINYLKILNNPTVHLNKILIYFHKKNINHNFKYLLFYKMFILKFNFKDIIKIYKIIKNSLFINLIYYDKNIFKKFLINLMNNIILKFIRDLNNQKFYHFLINMLNNYINLYNVLYNTLIYFNNLSKTYFLYNLKHNQNFQFFFIN